FDLATAARVNEFLGCLGDDGVAVVVEPVDQWPDRGIFLIFDDGGVVERANQRSPALELPQKALVIDIEAERLGSRVEIGSIDKERDLIGGRRHSKILQVCSWHRLGAGQSSCIFNDVPE